MGGDGVTIAIPHRRDDASPKILAQGLHHMLSELGVESTLYPGGDEMLRRLLPLYRRPRHWYLRPHARLLDKWRHREEDRAYLEELRAHSAVIWCECIPNAYWRAYYDLESLRKRLPSLPILLYSVFYLENDPLRQRLLASEGDHGIERFDWHLAVSDATFIRNEPAPPWSAIGLDLTQAHLEPRPRSGFRALVDFAQAGFERCREEQIRVLEECGIEYTVLEGKYTMEEIREEYRRTSVYFLQWPESFGVPIAECLLTGAYVFTPCTGWPMAFRLEENPLPRACGLLPDFFVSYRGREELREKLLSVRDAYDLARTPRRVSEAFRRAYPHLWKGRLEALREVVDRIREGSLAARPVS